MVGVLVQVLVGVTVLVGVLVTVGVAVSDAQALSRIDTLFTLGLAATRSCLPSPLKSATATDIGLLPTAKLVGAPKEPVPVPSSTNMLLEPELAVARSC